MSIMHQFSDLSASLKQLHNRSQGTHWKKVKRRSVSPPWCPRLLPMHSTTWEWKHHKETTEAAFRPPITQICDSRDWLVAHLCHCISAAGEALCMDVCSWRGMAFGSFSWWSSAFCCSLPTSRVCSVLVVVLLFLLTHTEPDLNWKILSCLFPFLLLWREVREWELSPAGACQRALPVFWM